MPKIAALGVVMHKIIRIVFGMLKNKHHQLFVALTGITRYVCLGLQCFYFIS